MQMESKTSVVSSPNPHRPKRVILAFLVAPLAGPLGLSCGVVYSLPLKSFSDIFPLLLSLYLFTTPVIYFFSIILGIPLYLLLRYLEALGRNQLVVSWAGLAMVSLVIFSGGHLPARPQEFLVFIPFALGGGAVGLLFWRMLNPKRLTHSTSLGDAPIDGPNVARTEAGE